MPSFAETMAAMAVFSDEDMGRPWKWRGEGSDLGVRDGYHRTLEAELAQLAGVESGTPATESILAMAEAQRALGRALGLLAGQPEELLDFEPAPDSWPLRQVVRHMLETELSFFANARWSLSRTDDQPVAMPPELRPKDDDAPGEGTISDVAARLVAARAATDAFLGELSPSELEKPSIWAGHLVDVRFRLHRFASHLTEHTIHAEKVLRSAGRDPGEARQMVRAIWAARGAHEHRSPPATLARLDQEHAATLESLRL
jgi:DinB superfamily